MKIQTDLEGYQHYKVRFKDTFVTFKNGIADVKNEELANYIVSNFKEYYLEGKKPKVEKVSVSDLPFTEAEFLTLKDKLDEAISDKTNLINSNKSLKKQLVDKEADLESWKNKFNELNQNFIKLKDGESEEVKTPDNTISDDSEELNSDEGIKKELHSKGIPELKEIAKELGVTDGDLEGHKNQKKTWVDAIIAKDKSANN